MKKEKIEKTSSFRKKKQAWEKIIDGCERSNTRSNIFTTRIFPLFAVRWTDEYEETDRRVYLVV
jgi:hypothetical protein